MTTILNFVNDLQKDAREAFFVKVRELAKCSMTENSFRKQVSKGQQFSPAVCSAFEEFSNGEVTRQSLRPDDWDVIWPELKPNKSA